MASRAPAPRRAAQRPQRRPWTRSEVRRASTSPAQLEALLIVLPSFPRATITLAVDRMIERLDQIDGDPDFEDDDDDCAIAASCLAIGAIRRGEPGPNSTREMSIGQGRLA